MAWVNRKTKKPKKMHKKQTKLFIIIYKKEEPKSAPLFLKVVA